MLLHTLMPSVTKMIDSDYKSVKSIESEHIILASLQGLKPVEKPVLLQVSGIPGAGKSTYCSKNIMQNYIYISFDKIMQSLSSYQKDLKTKGMVFAYQHNEMPARIIGYELLSRAINQKLNIMLEHSGTNQAHLELFDNIKQYGYTTTVNFIMCDINKAIIRAKARSKETKRYIPDKTIIERASNINNYISSYQKIANTINVLDGTNNFAPLKKI